MGTRERLANLEKAVAALPGSDVDLTDWSNGDLALAAHLQVDPAEVAERFENLTWFLEAEAYPGPGIFDVDPEFRPAWNRFTELWFDHHCSSSGGNWLAGCCDFWTRAPQQPEVLAAQHRVLDIMRRVLLAHPQYAVLGKLIPPSDPEPIPEDDHP
jgi:hypothetical protein